MMIIGCDFHPSWQQVSWLDTETGETGEQKLVQASGDAERFYRQVAAPALIGMEATGNCHWLVDLLAELGHELWVGDAAQIRASYVRQQNTDERDAAHILKLLVEGRFPRILRELPLQPWAGRRRDDLLKLMAMLDQQIEPLDQAVQAEAQRDKMALLLQTQPGVGPITALAYVLTHGRCQPLPARQAGGQLSGPDSARALLGGTAEAGCDHQAGQPHAAHVAGGSGAGGGALRSRVS